MKKLGVVLAVLGIVLLGASCDKQSPPKMTDDTIKQPTVNNANPTAVKPVAKTVTVSYTSNGFVPKSITINIGDTVKFVNTGTTSAVWPAANPHPIHTSVPGFDAKRPLDTGGTFSFTFTKAQTVQYHNHLNPSEAGTIVVK